MQIRSVFLNSGLVASYNRSSKAYQNFSNLASNLTTSATRCCLNSRKWTQFDSPFVKEFCLSSLASKKHVFENPYEELLKKKKKEFLSPLILLVDTDGM